MSTAMTKVARLEKENERFKSKCEAFIDKVAKLEISFKLISK
jgi:hypothetical protein